MQNKNRSKLKKYLGKRVRYSARTGRRSEEKQLLLDVKINERKISDHIWIDGEKFTAFKKGEAVTFIAIAYTYTDTKGKRKNGLKYPHQVTSLEYFKNKPTQDDIEKHKRLGWKKK